MIDLLNAAVVENVQGATMDLRFEDGAATVLVGASGLLVETNGEQPRLVTAGHAEWIAARRKRAAWLADPWGQRFTEVIDSCYRGEDDSVTVDLPDGSSNVAFAAYVGADTTIFLLHPAAFMEAWGGPNTGFGNRWHYGVQVFSDDLSPRFSALVMEGEAALRLALGFVVEATGSLAVLDHWIMREVGR
jgi:hypothetical protein